MINLKTINARFKVEDDLKYTRAIITGGVIQQNTTEVLLENHVFNNRKAYSPDT